MVFEHFIGKYKQVQLICQTPPGLSDTGGFTGDPAVYEVPGGVWLAKVAVN
jgi:hypothetical protein